MEVEDCAAAFFGDHAHGVVENFATVAVGGEDVACGAARVYTDENGMGARRPCGTRVAGDVGRAVMAGGATGAQIAAHERDVAFAAVDLAFVSDHAEFAVLGLDAGFACADNVALMAEAVADKFGDGEDAEVVLGAERNEVGDACHFAVITHDFADDAGGLEAGEAGEVDRGFGLSGANEDSALACAERKDVAGTDEIAGSGCGIDGRADGVGAVGRGDAGGDAFASFDGLSEGRAEARGVLLRHGKEAEVVGALFCERQADKTATIAGHEVDGLGRDVLRSKGQVALRFRGPHRRPRRPCGRRGCRQGHPGHR